MSIQSDFLSFLTNIEPSKTTKEKISSIQNNLRDYLKNHDKYKDIMIESFLIGSYAKNTCIRPKLHDGKPDVDIAIVTNYSESNNSKDVLDELYEILKEKYTNNNITKQKRSIGIEMEQIELDIVPLIKKDFSKLYMIGDKTRGGWNDTNPKKHLEWVSDINSNENKVFIPLVKIFKWWRRINCPDTIKYPKGILLEKIISENIMSVDKGYQDIVYDTMNKILENYKINIESNTLPFVSDPGITINNLFDGYKFEDFKSFYNKVQNHVNKLQEDKFSNDIWREVLGNEFPKSSNVRNILEDLRSLVNINIFNVPHRIAPIWESEPNIGSLNVTLKCIDKNNTQVNYSPNGTCYLATNIKLYFNIVGESLFNNDCSIYWQVVNTGKEAETNNCLRGDRFELPNSGIYGKYEETAYVGTHWVQAFMVKNNKCIAKSEEIIINVK